MLKKTNEKRYLYAIAGLSGILMILFALFSDRLGLDNNAYLGFMQVMLILFGVLLLLFAILMMSLWGRKIRQAWTASKVEQTSLDGNPLKKDMAEILLVASFLGLLSGFSEAFLLSLMRLTPGWLTWNLTLTYVSSDSLWVTPVVNWALFSLLAFLLAPFLLMLSRIKFFRKITPAAIAVLIFTWLYFWIELRILDRLNDISISILALGLSFQAARWYSGHKGFFLSVFRKGIPVLASLMLGFLIIFQGAERVRENSLIRELPDKQPNRPNVIVIVVDTLRADHLSAYGYGKPTSPHIDAFAREGVLFENAFSSSSWTPPGHASLMTGLSVREHQVDGANPVLDDKFLTLAEFLKEEGYLTAGFSANTYFVNQNMGFSQGFVHFEDYYWSWKDMVNQTVLGRAGIEYLLSALGHHDIFGRKYAKDVNNAVISWLDKYQQKPFFVFINYFDVHDPYYAPAPYDSIFIDSTESNQAKSPSASQPMTRLQEENLARMDAYDGSIAYVDDMFVQLMDELKKRELFDNTLIILTSDHGELFGEHNLLEHGNSLYREVTRIPMIMRYPGLLPSNQRVNDPVSIKEIPATIEAVLFPDQKPVFPGQSLTSFISTDLETAQRSSAPVLIELTGRNWLPKDWPVSQGWIRSLVNSQYQYITYKSGKVELFRLNNGGADGDLSTTPEGEAVIGRFADDLRMILKSKSSSVNTQ